jgi:hypothetical protein
VNDGQQRFDLSRTAQDEEPETDLTDDSPFVFSQSEIQTIGLHRPARSLERRLRFAWPTSEGARDPGAIHKIAATRKYGPTIPRL